MDDTSKASLGRLVRSRRVLALGTLHEGAPFVSMAPFAVSNDGSAFYLLVSGLAQHTRDMLDDPRISLMISESEDGGQAPQALARVTIEGRALELRRDDRGHEAARACYLARLPQSRALFELDDFSLFAVVPSSARFVGGFARAFTLAPAELSDAIAGNP